MPRFIFPAALVAVLLASPLWPARVAIAQWANSSTVLTARHVNLSLNVLRKSTYPGFPVLARATFRNKGKRMFVLFGFPVRLAFSSIRVICSATDLSATRTNCMLLTPKVWSFHGLAALVVRPGKSRPFWRRINFSKYYDMTMPGKYRVQLVAGKIASDVATAVVSPFPTAVAAVALLPGPPLVGKWPGGRAGLRVLARQPRGHSISPVRLRLLIRGSSRRAGAVDLTGNPLVDFAHVQVTGPSVGEVTLVKKPKPHYVPYIRKNPAPLTAYGHWLAKHPVRGLKVKTYTLKPGVVYKYAEPINLSCMYDMSLAGVYRVRVQLAHTHVWSPWANVKVP